jgi:hypothetical protein
MAMARVRLEWDQTSLIWSTIANANRDPKEQPKPFLPSDVHPLRNASDYEQNEEANRPAIEKIKRTCKVTRLNGYSFHRSREGVSPSIGR